MERSQRQDGIANSTSSEAAKWSCFFTVRSPIDSSRYTIASLPMLMPISLRARSKLSVTGALYW